MSDFNLDILPKIRAIDESLAKIRLKEVSLKRNGEADFTFICDKAVSDDACMKIEGIIREYMPESFPDCRANAIKIVADPELVKNEIYRYLTETYMSVAHSISLDDIKVFPPENGKCEYALDADDDVYEYVTKHSVLEKLSAHLYGEFCCLFSGKANDTGKSQANEEILKVKLNSTEYQTIKFRTLTVKDPVKLWGEEIDGTAIYIADSALASGICCFAGKVESISTRETKTGKEFYLVELNDTTGKIVGKIFMTNEKRKKIEKIQVGTQIICRGEIGSYNGMQSFKIIDVSFCEFPEDFKAEERESKSVPALYSLVFPEKIEDMEQSFLFKAEKPVPKCLMGRTFTVLDIETTGLSYINGDKITEIGAVRVVDGKIVDKFQTLINPQKKISAEITSLTGIDDEMVKDKPTIDKIIPDLFKYADGSIIVGHNLDFDYKFIKYFAKESGYIFKNDGIDTCSFARAVVPRLKNYKLNTVCEKFGIEFLHHRALSDAHATAKLFIELVGIKGDLPDFM